MENFDQIHASASDKPVIGRAETDNRKLRRILAEIARLLADAQALIEQSHRTRHEGVHAGDGTGANLAGLNVAARHERPPCPMT